MDDLPDFAFGVAMLLAVPLGGVLAAVGGFRVALVGRAVLWTAVAWMTFASLLSPISLGAAGALPICAGLSLLALGREGLEDGAHATFAPAALRAPLLAVVVLSMSDAMALGFLGVLLRDSPSPWLASLAFGASAVMAVVVWGLLRLRTWAVVLNVLANFGIAAGAWATAFTLELPPLETIALCLSLTAFGQLVVGFPLLRGLTRGATPAPSLGRGPTVAAIVVSAALLTIIVDNYFVQL